MTILAAFWSMFIVLAICEAKMAIEVNDEFSECDNGMPLLGVDVSNVDVALDDEKGIIMNGNFTLLRDFIGPVQWRMHTKRFERGAWQEGLVSREVKDMCRILLSPLEPWYKVTSKMQQKQCPYLAGHTEHFENLEMGEMGMGIPPNFAGEWELYMEITTEHDKNPFTDCILVRFRILEV